MALAKKGRFRENGCVVYLHYTLGQTPTLSTNIDKNRVILRKKLLDISLKFRYSKNNGESGQQCGIPCESENGKGKEYELGFARPRRGGTASVRRAGLDKAADLSGACQRRGNARRRSGRGCAVRQRDLHRQQLAVLPVLRGSLCRLPAGELPRQPQNGRGIHSGLFGHAQRRIPVCAPCSARAWMPISTAARGALLRAMTAPHGRAADCRDRLPEKPFGLFPAKEILLRCRALQTRCGVCAPSGWVIRTG